MLFEASSKPKNASPLAKSPIVLSAIFPTISKPATNPSIKNSPKGSSAESNLPTIPEKIVNIFVILFVASSLLFMAFFTKAKAKTKTAKTAPIGVAIKASEAFAIPKKP